MHMVTSIGQIASFVSDIKFSSTELMALVLKSIVNLNSYLWRAWWWEPFLATFWFGVFINIYWYYERRQGLSAVTKFSDTVRLELGPLFSSGLAYWVGISLWTTVVPPAAASIPDGIPTSPTKVLYVAAEVVSGVVLYDAIFFFFHWAMHDIPCLRIFHRRHHQVTHRVESCDTLRHSLADGSLQVLVNILVQRTTPWGIVKSRCARHLHNIIVIWMLVESHSACPEPNIWRRWFVGVREHRLHHLGLSSSTTPSGGGGSCKSIARAGYGKHHRHQQFFGYLDDLRATVVDLLRGENGPNHHEIKSQ